ncbi:MAG TPA: hypothetical protein VFC84_04615 [Desulfosporosinus sp.]|nr:hypothetical protein [Desulfosporosinus sp.]
MWRRWIRELKLELHWTKRNIIRRWQLDTPIGILGIVILSSALLLIFVLGNGMAQIFRAFIPWVSGSRVGEVYWQSIGFGIKTSVLFLVFIGSLIMFFTLKFSDRRFRK